MLAVTAAGAAEDGDAAVLPPPNNGVATNQDFDENGKFSTRAKGGSGVVLPTSAWDTVNADIRPSTISPSEDEEGARNSGGDQGVVLQDRGGVSKDRLAFPQFGTREVDRLFSTLEPCDVSGFKRKPSNLLGATALVGGTAVGAGILALPAATLQAGLLPSSVGLIGM